MNDDPGHRFDSDAHHPPARQVRAFTRLVRTLVCVVVFAQAATAFCAGPDLIGLTRADVIASLGKPQSTLQRGDTELLVYPNGVRVDLRDDQVVAFRGSPQAVIIASDGTRYLPGENGKVRRADPAPEMAEIADDAAAAGATTARDATAASPAKPIAAAPKSAAKPATAAATTHDSPVPDADAHMAKMRAEMEKAVEDMEKPPPPPPPTPVGVKIFSAIVSIGLHFVIVVAVLRLALHLVGVPFFWPDLLKVSVLTVAVREGLHGLSELGGYLEFIALFKIDDAVSLVALALFLFHFKIALSGLTALKVAAATKVATYMLMIGVGLALTFGLMAFK